MTAIRRTLTAHWFLTLVGALALALSIWFAGPLIAVAGVVPLAPAWARLLGVMAVLVAWGLWNLLRLRRERARASELESGVMAGGAGEDERAVLEERLNRAVELLRRGGAGRTKAHYLYQLPWYLLIGPPGSGKTTALRQSGLRFPIDDQQGPSVRGVGGTRNCDWWFADEAVLLDTAGRYTTQDSQPAGDNAAWTGFLDLVRRTRPRQPINGALVAISVGELLAADESQRDAHARAIRGRLRELHQHLGVRVPVYVLLTKADLLAGFTAFFDDLGPDGRRQPWGVTLPYDDGGQPGGAVSQLESELDGLLTRLTDRALDRVHHEPDPDRRGTIAAFPTQLEALKPVLTRFLDEVFRPARLDEHFLLRGVYLTSGTQEGRPVDRVLAAMSSSLGIDAAPATAGQGERAYFIHDVLRRVVFGEAGLVSTHPRAERRDRWVRAGAAGAAAAAVAAVLGAWTVSYRENTRLIADVREAVAGYRENVADLDARAVNEPGVLRVLPALNALRRLPVEPEAPPLRRTAGLNQDARLGAQASAAYERALENLLLPVLIARMEERVRQRARTDEDLFEPLKVYLMLGGNGPLDAEVVRTHLASLWRSRLAGRPAATREALGAHLDALLERGTLDYPLAGSVIRAARERVRQEPLPERAYAMIRSSESARDVPAWRMPERIGGAARQVFRHTGERGLGDRIPGIYTKTGFYEAVLPGIARVVERVNRESWVLGDEGVDVPGPDELRRRVLARYYRDYTRTWREYLAELRHPRARSLDELRTLVDRLATPTSPAVDLLERVSHQTKLDRPPKDTAAGAAEAGADVAQDASGGSTSRLGDAAGEKFGELATRPGKPVAADFRPLHDFIGGRGLDAYINDLKTVKRRLRGAERRGETLSADLITVQSGLPPAVRRWMAGLSETARQVAVDQVREPLVRAWNTEVRPLCREVVAGRYPFDADSERPAPVADFARLFRRGGALDSFYQEHLRERVREGSEEWTWRGERAAELGLPSGMPEQFRLARSIREAYFQRGGEQPGAAFTLKPETLDPDAAEVGLRIHGTSLRYAHGPPRATRITWPSGGGKSFARVRFEDREGATHARSHTGPWAWFRLLDANQLSQAGGPDVMRVRFEVDGHTAGYTLRSDSVRNPLTVPLRSFSCPPKL